MANMCIFCFWDINPNRLRFNCKHSFCEKCIGDGDRCLFCNKQSEIIGYNLPTQPKVKRVLLEPVFILDCIILLAYPAVLESYTDSYYHLKSIDFINLTYEEVLSSIFEIVPDQSLIDMDVCLFFSILGESRLAYSPEMTFLSNSRDIVRDLTTQYHFHIAIRWNKMADIIINNYITE
ncbi:hypothetical protein DFA_06367 [Cavenderia fasciculata]|uniref:RING-type domain-containing protein n=1 Tax=Cavenderia fasciculata TaxID=261658 RepID=F4PKU6_CACFS|nr:uncharacterized protein DFA_06367 [Cavenderia fasciculata]EGG24220.1 hypothetical protein DFA_06367 [Cavenderia fasciculata]|eukprot:XP_004362071.1 hypothetical protein DFA_06367 [Cavenderia fasciculata]